MNSSGALVLSGRPPRIIRRIINFSSKPHRHGHAKAAKAARRERELGLEQPLEFQHRLVVERDEVELVGL